MTYKVIGKDGREYGPVTVDQLRFWIADGRADAQTKAQREGSTEWIPLGTLPELADAFATPAPPRMGTGGDSDRWAEEILARDYQIDIGGSISRGWDLIKSDFWLLVGATAVACLLAAGCGIPYLGIVISLVVCGPMMGGLWALYLKKIRRETANFGDVFLGFGTAFGSLLAAYVVSSLLTMAGLILCIVPGIYLGISWVFTLALVMDRKMDFWPAMELSRKVVGKHWWTMFGFLIVLALLSLVGLIACCVGMFVTIAISYSALMYAYEDIFGAPRAATGEKPVAIA